MKSNVVILLVMAAYFAVADIAYVIWNFVDNGGFEPVGSAAMALLVILAVFIAYYLNSGMKRTATLPEDRLEGNIEDDSGEVGFYSPWSWWPLALGFSAAIAFAGLAAGWWLFYIAIPFAVVSIVGFVYEYDRGQHAH
jgi:hypothetical protein